ncbi:sigma-54 dependent transcriptional regulator [Pendulispora brunnea]|uniref:Sigma-54 dependent transcriptional regulator n=2 Tax=Pendulispora brunnea TaxID=2905690 RepID=A0ABZ2K2Z5_9BACT
MRRLYPLLQRVAASDVPVIIEGETGTGKEVLAESIHAQSRRSRGPFIVFDCTAVSPNLVESALFGHERGAFTGAVSPRQGVFEQAHGGTLLIDELGDLDSSLQPKLLRAVERSEIQRVGGTSWAKTNVRVICTTRRNLRREVRAGRFRDDLYYRLAVTCIELPPLRKRTADIPLLARHFWRELGGDEAAIPTDFLESLERYDWPGNVRELHNAVVHRLALGELADERSSRRYLDDEPVASSEMPIPSGEFPAHSMTDRSGDFVDTLLRDEPRFTEARERVLREFERRYVRWILQRYDGNVTRAAEASGLARRSLYALKTRAGKGST